MAEDDFSEAVGGIKADIRMFSGCRDEETSADVHDVARFGLPDAEGAGGACTNAVLVNLKDNKADTWMSLLKGMRGTLVQKRFKQVPQLATSRELDLTQPFSLSGGGGGKHRALLIGINYKGMRGELKGCHNDVASIKEYIPEHGFPDEEGPNLRILSDDDEHDHPTKDNILAGIDWLVEDAEPGDSLFMHFSGHGGSVRDTSGDEEDARDETMIPLDYAQNGMIKDDEIFARLVAPLPEGVTLSVLMDCCHSGSILDLPYAFDATENGLRALEGGGHPIVQKKPKFNAKKTARIFKGGRHRPGGRGPGGRGPGGRGPGGRGPGGRGPGHHGPGHHGPGHRGPGHHGPGGRGPGHHGPGGAKPGKHRSGKHKAGKHRRGKGNKSGSSSSDSSSSSSSSDSD